MGKHPGGGAQGAAWKTYGPETPPNRLPIPGIPRGNLVGIPWRVALALQDDGWILRSDIIWNKPNPRPESVRTRPTKSHEYLFLLAKTENYFYDVDAIREPQKTRGERHEGKSGYRKEHPNRVDVPNKYGISRRALHPLGKNKPTVWTIATRRYAAAHFATFPPDLIEPCVLAGSRVGDVVLDPFFGSGTVGQVAAKHGRRWIGFDINPAYEALQKERTAQRSLVLEVKP